MRKLVIIIAALWCMAVHAQNNEVFEAYKTSELRLPAVPLIVNDPFFSIWSPYDFLQQGPTKHWTSADKPLLGLLRVDDVTYRFMGEDNREVLETILPMAGENDWKAPHMLTTPQGEWYAENYDDSAWPIAQGAFGKTIKREIHTQWGGDNTDIYVRRSFELTQEELQDNFVILYSHDDICEIYLNGTKIHDTGLTSNKFQRLYLSKEQQKLLHAGRNVLAVHCHNSFGSSLLDFGIYKVFIHKANSVLMAKQKSINVMATSSYYTMTCGGVDIDLVFTAPMLINDYDLLSTPINYISYRVRSNDGRVHKVQLGLFTTPEMAMDNFNRGITPSVSTIVSPGNGTSFARCGNLEQPILKKSGDRVCCNWGYFYLSDVNGRVGIAPYAKAMRSFIASGRSLNTADSITSYHATDLTALSYVHDFGRIGQESKASFVMMGYDEVKDIEYHGKQYKAYWAHDGKVSIFDAFARLQKDYEDIMKKCKAWDKTIYDDGFKAGGKEYAEMLAGNYRLVMAAHKLFKDDQGHLLYFSKENDSNGSVNTVDLTYPEAPLYLTYNPELEKAMMTSILEYSKSGKWTKPFAAHDMGTYPIANGQTYKGDMPLEECGNMLTLAATLCMLDGNTKYVDPYWDILTLWNKYLVENGQDPSNQLCTDDFAGHWAHNCNLSAKAIMGILGYSKMAQMKGLLQEAKNYEKIAKKMAVKWEKDAREKDHYRLAFDRDSTWSQKYNMIWDKLWSTNIFPRNAIQTEVKFYTTHMNHFGLPLDSRKTYTKSDWIMWSAAMANSQEDFFRLMHPIYTYIHETESRVPLSDWHDTKTGKYQAFIGRSVIGGYWMKVFADKFIKKQK